MLLDEKHKAMAHEPMNTRRACKHACMCTQYMEAIRAVRAIPRDARVIPRAEGDTLGHLVYLKE